MNYDTAYKRFDLDRIINRSTNLDYIELLDSLNKESINAEVIVTSSAPQYRRDIEYLQETYVSSLKGFLFLLKSGIKPAGVKNETLMKFKPILESLIEKKQLEASILDVLK